VTNYLIYVIAFLVGLAFPVGPKRWLLALVVAIAVDDFRFKDFALSNAILMASMGSFCKSKYLLQTRGKAPAFAPTFLLLVAATITTVFSESPTEGISIYISLCTLIGVALVIPSVINSHTDLRSFIRMVLWMSGLTSAGVLVESIAYYLFGIQLKDNIFVLLNLQQDALSSTGFFSSNGLAGFHILPGLVLAALVRSENIWPGSTRRLISYTALCLLAAILTFSRSTLFSIFLLLVVILYRKVTKTGGIRLIAFVLLGAGVLIAPLGIEFLVGFNRGSFLARYCILYGAFQSIRNHFSFGSGLGSRVYEEYPPTSWGEEAMWSGMELSELQRDTHNTIVQVTVDLGVTGLCCVVAMHVVLLKKWRRVGRTVRNLDAKGHANALMWTLLVVEFFSLSNSVLYTKPLWILFGMASGGLLCAEMFRKATIAESKVAANEQRFPARLAAITDATTCPKFIE